MVTLVTVFSGFQIPFVPEVRAKTEPATPGNEKQRLFVCLDYVTVTNFQPFLSEINLAIFHHWFQI